MTKASAPVLVLPWKEETYTPPSAPSSPSLSESTPGTSGNPYASTDNAPSVAEMDAQLDAEAVEACAVCRSHPNTVALADRWLARNLDGSLELDLKSLYKIVRSIHRFTPSIDTLRKHLKTCRSEDYARLRAR